MNGCSLFYGSIHNALARKLQRFAHKKSGRDFLVKLYDARQIIILSRSVPTTVETYLVKTFIKCLKK